MLTILLRTLIVYAVVIISMRLMGKRQLGELELSEFAVTVLIADLAANPLQNLDLSLLHGLAPVVVLLICELLLSYLCLKSLRFRMLLCGRPSMLIADGKIDQREMKKNRFTIDELAEELRKQNITDISKVRYAVLETDGTLNTVLYAAEQPVTPSQLQLEVEESGYSTILINDGKILEKNLRRVGRDGRWLEKELQRRGAQAADSVYLLSINHAGQIYYAAKDQKKH